MVKIESKKQFHDNIHGLIQVSNLAIKIINTPEFQRLRQLHQLGTAFYVYPTATHTRFEHSLGTYFLAGKLLESIRRDTSVDHLNECLRNVPELVPYYKRTYGKDPHHKLDGYVCELVKIAGLCHDLGHGPFSHIFDDIFIPMVKDDVESYPMELHEFRSCFILEKIIKRDESLSKIIMDPEIQFIKDLINPDKSKTGFIYQIISNNLNSVDVDKYDYMARDSYTLGLRFGFNHNRLVEDARVIDNTICYPEQISYEVVSIFQTRYRLHKQIYSHKVVITTQMMICEMMVLLNPIMRIYNSIFDIDQFCQLTDDYILSAVKYLYQYKERYNPSYIRLIEMAHDIYLRLNRRDLYQFVFTVATDHKLKEDLTKTLNLKDDPNIIVYEAKIGFVSGGKKNPLDELYFFKTKNPTVCHKLPKEQISLLLPDRYQEHLNMIILRNKDDKLKQKILKMIAEQKDRLI